MKKVIFTLIVLIFLTGMAFGASCTNGSLTVTGGTGGLAGHGVEIKSLAYTSTAGGAVSGGANCDIPINGYIYMVVYEYGDSDATIDVTLADSDGKDVMSGDDNSKQLTDLAQYDQQFAPLVGGSSMARYVNGPVSLTIAGAGNATTGTLHVYIYRE